jgi:hypothetical protein
MQSRIPNIALIKRNSRSVNTEKLLKCDRFISAITRSIGLKALLIANHSVHASTEKTDLVDRLSG